MILTHMTAPTAPPNLVRPLTYLALAAALAYLVYLLSPILTPFLLAIALAYLGDPWVDRLQRLRVPRALAALLVMLALLLAVVALILLLAPLVRAQFELLLQQLPALLAWAEQTLLPWLRQTLGLDLPTDRALLGGWLREHLKDLGGLSASVPQLADRGFALVGFLAGLLLVPVVIFYLLRDWDRILSQLADWIPRPVRPRMLAILGEIDAVLAQFVRAQLGVIVLMALIYSLGLWLIGLDYALAVGVVSGVLVFVPYLGLIVGVTLGSLAAWTQFGEFTALIQVWAVFALGQLLEGMVITPWLVGERLGLHPVAVIFALMAFGQLFGFLGILLAIPAAAATLVLLRHLRAELDRV